MPYVEKVDFEFESDFLTDMQFTGSVEKQQAFLDEVETMDVVCGVRAKLPVPEGEPQQKKDGNVEKCQKESLGSLVEFITP